MRKVAVSAPVWLWTLLAMITGVGRNLFIAEMTFNSVGAMFAANVGSFVVMLVLIGVAYGVIARIVIRVIYSFSSRIYFRHTSFVPDYNLRRLPMSYNEFCAVCLLFTTIFHLIALVLNVLIYVVPTAYYLIIFFINVALIGVFAAVWFVIRPQVEDWQVKRIFFALSAPSMVVLVLCVLGGV